MCGRFARYSLSRELERFFNAHPPPFEIQPNYNVAPTQEIPVIVIHPEAGPYKSCTIITTDASDSVRDVHNRMPLILKPEAYDDWLDPNNKEPSKIAELLKTAYVKELKRYPVSKLVNQVGNSKKECVEPLKDSSD